MVAADILRLSITIRWTGYLLGALVFVLCCLFLKSTEGVFLGALIGTLIDLAGWLISRVLRRVAARRQ